MKSILCELSETTRRDSSDGLREEHRIDKLVKLMEACTDDYYRRKG